MLCLRTNALSSTNNIEKLFLSHLITPMSVLSLSLLTAQVLEVVK